MNQPTTAPVGAPTHKKVSFQLGLSKVNKDEFYQGETGLYATFTGKATPTNPYNAFMLTQYLGKGVEAPIVGNGKYRGQGEDVGDFSLKVDWNKVDMSVAYEGKKDTYVTLDVVWTPDNEYNDAMVVQYIGKGQDGPIVGNVKLFERKSEAGFDLPSGMGDGDGMPF
jgi:hypothetical protein